jgi:hypothetical protein
MSNEKGRSGIASGSALVGDGYVAAEAIVREWYLSGFGDASQGWRAPRLAAFHETVTGSPPLFHRIFTGQQIDFKPLTAPSATMWIKCPRRNGDGASVFPGMGFRFPLHGRMFDPLS